MASLHPNLAFDTLAFAKALIDKGYDRNAAEALAETQREFFVQNLASEEAVNSAVQEAKTELKHDIADVKAELKHDIADVKQEIVEVKAELKQEIADVKYAVKAVDDKIDREIAQLENRLTKTLGRMFVASVSILAIIMPIVYIILQKLLVSAP